MAKLQGEVLPKRMKAVVCHAPKDYRLEEVATPQAGPGEVVVRVEACGVCASDIKCFVGAPLFWGDERRKGYVETPVVPGHEFVGEVVQLGEGAAEKYGLKVGDRAVSEQIIPCWGCRFCRTGKYWMCQVHNIYGFKKAAFGGMAEYMKYPAGSLVYKIPSDMPANEAAVIEPLACSIHAVQRGEIEFGDVVAIAGAGPLGLGMVGAARLKNPGILIVLDTKDYRLEIAKKLGADLVINPTKEDAVAKVKDLTGGYGCDVYIEATGHPSAVIQGLDMIRKLGTFVEFSVMASPVAVDWTIIGDTKELNIHGAHLSPHAYPLAIDYIYKRKIDVRPMITHRLPLADYKRALDKVHDALDSIKVQLVP
jgi:2-desacetyl-2-hydroxyethyl bacteriochlorophyllide A dehydrogenase